MDSSASRLLCKSFYMSKENGSEKTNKLIFRKRFLAPINLEKKNTISFFRISGFKTWTSLFITQLLDGKVNENDFLIRVTLKGIDENRFVLIQCPSHIFLTDLDYITQYIQKLINNKLPENSILFESYRNGFIYFKILDSLIEVEFGIFLCSLFGFDPGVVYKNSSLRNTFALIPSFRDFRLNHVGVSLNLLFNSHLPSGSNRSDVTGPQEVVTLLDTTDISYGNSFTKILIDRPEDMKFRSQSFFEIELRFVDLSSGQILDSYLPKNHYEELFCAIAFS